MATQSSGIRGIGSAVTAGLAFALGTVAILTTYRRRYEQQSEHHRHAALAAQQRLQFDMLGKAMDDPDLAAVLDTFDAPLDPRTLRQYLFANALYTNTLLAWRVGILGWEELHGHLRLICQNAIFRGYWEATRPHRASLVDASDEARLGRMVDKLVQDLEDADTDEWWVVGEPPSDDG
ncbi:DUF6082 family protein [Streptomyces sp. NPDC005480]|jgi:hypothetical protein|uniref:DUF6082 family protein n=1 Tax=Streptomyces sp. NPDC005480 TaxID=3154880 RepID=UPI0033B29980